MKFGLCEDPEEIVSLKTFEGNLKDISGDVCGMIFL
jgi:hypothetical protein